LGRISAGVYFKPAIYTNVDKVQVDWNPWKPGHHSRISQPQQTSNPQQIHVQLRVT